MFSRLIRKVFLPFLLESRTLQLLARALLDTHVVFGDRRRVRIGKSAVVNNALFNVQSGDIEIGESVFFGHNVCLLTGTHDYGKAGGDRVDAVPPAGRDIVVGEGAWIASNATILGPCRIGEHAVVAAGAVVTGDVDAYTVVAGIPARAIKSLDGRQRSEPGS